MGKYEPLALHLAALGSDNWDASFHEIERVLGFSLPPSASAYNAWWANESKGSHVQKQGWRDAGWETRQVDLQKKRVRFARRTSPPNPQPGRRDESVELLIERARDLTGLKDRDAVVRVALAAFIRAEAAKKLIALGGTMPDFAAPARERPSE